MATRDVQLSVHIGRLKMKSVLFTDFRKKASDLITEVEHGETLILLRRGKPVAEVIPFSDKAQRTPAWKLSGIRLRMKGSDLSSAILEERKTTS
jgi:prevent-host-death family protein